MHTNGLPVPGLWYTVFIDITFLNDTTSSPSPRGKTDQHMAKAKMKSCNIWSKII